MTSSPEAGLVPSHIQVDIMGPFLPLHNCASLLSMSDQCPEGFSFADTIAETCTQVSCEDLVFWYNTPCEMTSYCGAQFTFRLWVACAETSSYHPQVNRLINGLHHPLESALQACFDGWDWISQLPWMMLGLRSDPWVVSGACPVDLVYRHAPCFPGEFTQPGTLALPSSQVQTPYHSSQVFAPFWLETLQQATCVNFQVDWHRTPYDCSYSSGLPKHWNVLQRLSYQYLMCKATLPLCL